MAERGTLAIDTVWAKLERGSGRWLSLPAHLADARETAALLWDRWLPASVTRPISTFAGGADAGRALVTFLAAVHDIGKASPAFASKAESIAPERIAAMAAAGFAYRPPVIDARLMPHGLVGHLHLADWLRQEWGAPRKIVEGWAVIVGGHHGTPPDAVSLDAHFQAFSAYGDGAWARARTQLLDEMAEETRAVRYLETWLQAPLPVPLQVSLTGIVIVADWIASDESHFGYDDAQPARARARAAWEALALPPPWVPSATPGPGLYGGRFPHLADVQLTAVQEAAIEAVGQVTGPPIVCVEAPMGSGKTELGLAVAEVLAARFGCGGVYVALPTMATSNAMFARVAKWIENLDGIDETLGTSVYLAHSKAALNDDYARLATAKFAGIDHEDAAQRATVNEWMRGRKRGLLANVVVGTIDQVLMCALRSKHLALRHLAFAGKVIIVDEVHASDVYMREYLKGALEWLASHGAPVVLMSATLPAPQRADLIAAYAKGRQAQVDASSVQGAGSYPRLTIWDGVLRAPDVGPPPTDRTVTVSWLPDELDTVVTRILAETANGGCIGIVRNTVGRAQETFEALRQRLGPDEVLLLHSRFHAHHRAERESSVVALLGPGVRAGTGRPPRLVVVGTQVIEQSLDVDFDLLITDLAPIDLLLQRMGRLHRHRRGEAEGDRPVRLRLPRCLVTGIGWGDEAAPAFPRGSKAVYGHAGLLRAAAVMHRFTTHPEIALPGEIPALVDAAYPSESNHLVAPRSWEGEWDQAHERERLDREKRTASAGQFRVAAPGARRSLVGWLATPADESPDDENVGTARVRDGEDGIEVVLLRRHAGRLRPMKGLGEISDVDVPVKVPPWPALALAIAGCSVRLPHAFTSNIEAIQHLRGARPPAWADSPWLARALVMLLDEDGRWCGAGMTATYDEEMGLTIRKRAAA